MTSKLGHREEDVRRWVAEGRTDGWIAGRLGARPTEVAAFRWDRSLCGPEPASADALRLPGDAKPDRRRSRRASRTASLRAILAFVGEKAPVTYEGLARRSGLSTSAVRIKVSELEEEGLVEVRKDRVDGRRRSVVVPVGGRVEIPDPNGGGENAAIGDHGPAAAARASGPRRARGEREPLRGGGDPPVVGA